MRSLLLVVWALALAIALALVVTSGIHETRSLQVLENAGFTRVRILGWKPLYCHQDFYATGFTAAFIHDRRRIAGVVCCDTSLKRCHIQFSAGASP